MKNKYLSASLGLYINYFVHGMALIIIAQNIDFLSKQWNTDNAGAAAVVSSLGIGKLVAVFFSGKLSDRFGRKPSVVLGIFFYVLFLAGILISPNVAVAYMFGISAGVANSFLDTGTYPALMEAFPKKSAPANIIIKAFIQGGQFVLPYLIGFLILRDLWFGWSFIFLIAVLSVNLVFILTRTFPPMTDISQASEESRPQRVRTFHFSLNEICLILFGFVAQTLLYILGQWIAKYGSEVVHMSEGSSRLLVSYGSLGAICCVLVTFTLGNRGIKSIYFMMLYTVMTAVISLVIWAFPVPVVCTAGAVLLGYFSSGGLIQLGLTLLAEKSSRGKGLVTSLYTIAEGVAIFTIPLVASAISRVNIGGIFLLNGAIALFGFTLTLIIFTRDKRPINEASVQVEQVQC
ncbi:MFS transporter [Paenibacillus durus]|uniref:MFS transporter n=1 Tax=Paenibacillus durus ATCC 35681 TaxID=1333534 RepID=A0A0F7CH40_PAEDU|nr:MFS transporter [Paenibacillus durus]AKG33450.1 MFS transporter [Paenibacillus durus ATCC 35681]